MEIVKKEVKYLNKEFGEFRANLVNFAKQYFPDTYSDFNEASPGMMFLEMAAYVGDVLSYYSDQSFAESMLSEAKETANVLQLAQLFGYKTKTNAPATGHLDIFQLLPSIGAGDDARPDWRYALSINSGMQVTSTPGVMFSTMEPVNFNFSSSMNPTEVSVYEIDASGDIQYYLLKKSVPIKSGEVISTDYTFGNPKPYDKILLTEDNIIEIISVTDSEGNDWTEVDYLAQDTVFEDVLNVQYNDVELSEYAATVPYILKMKRTPRRFITKLTDEGLLELCFGSGVSSDADEELIPNPQNVGMGLEYLKRTTTTAIDPTNFLRTRTYGLAPDNITLTVTYSVGGGIQDNTIVNDITTIQDITYNDEINYDEIDLTYIKNTVAINNPIPASGGKDRDDIENIRNNAMAAFAAQNRAITREDYIVRCYAMPKKFGSVAKAYIIGDTQQIKANAPYLDNTEVLNPMALNLYTLGYDVNKKLVPINKALRENLRTYLSNFRMLTDAINLKAAHIINIGVEFEIIPRPRYNSNEVILRCIQRLKELLHIDLMQINSPINISNIMTELDKIEGVQSVADFEIINHYDLTRGYCGNAYDIPTAIRNNILYPSLDPSIFEVKFPDKDIKGKIVSK
jgi:hypothetical protein